MNRSVNSASASGVQIAVPGVNNESAEPKVRVNHCLCRSYRDRVSGLSERATTDLQEIQNSATDCGRLVPHVTSVFRTATTSASATLTPMVCSASRYAAIWAS